MIRALCFSQDSKLRSDLQLVDVAFALQDTNNIVWVDFEASSPQEDEPILRKTFGFHPLAIDDALQESHVPKIDDWGQYLYIVLHAVVFDAKKEQELDTLELDIFVGKNYIVTHHDQPIEAVEHIWKAVHRDERHLKQGSDHLLYRILDDVAGSFMPVIEALDDEIDHLEDEIFKDPNNTTLEHIFMLKRSVLHLRRIVGPQREVLNKLARDDNKVIDSQERVYFRDVYDHLARMQDIIESMRDLVAGTLDTYLSVVNNRMNEIMKTLTVITTLFMPLAFITGFFGMNFFQPSTPLDIWTGMPAFIITLLFTLLIPLAMFVWIRRRRWM